jgi:hypothetical protein
MLAAALEYASKGWPVFPLRPRDKVPSTKHGLKDATTDEATIRRWWQNEPNANIGFATGNGVAVVDIDELGSWTDLLEDAKAPSPDTSRVETSRGFQLFFTTTTEIRNSAGKLRPGLDIRGDGGYVVLPPSVHPSGHIYRWDRNGTPTALPDWLYKLLTAKAKPPPRRERSELPPGDETPYGRAALEAETAIVASAIEGTRNDRLNTAALKLGSLVAGGELDEHDVKRALIDAALSAGLTEHEAEQTIKSGMSKGLSQPRNAPPSARARSLHSVPTPPDTPTQAAPPAADKLTVRWLDTYKIRRVEWLDRPFLQRSAFHLLAGRKGSCKGTWLAGIASRVTTGDLYGEPKRVLVITSEDSVELDFKPRVIAAGGDDTMCGIVNGPFKLPTNIPWLQAQAEQLGNVGLIVIDPIGNHTGGKDTNDEGDVRAAIQDLNPLADDLDCMVIGVRHLGKDSSRGALASVLGSTAWVDVPRCVIAMAADDEDELLFHAQVLIGNRGPRKNTGRAFRLELIDVPPAVEITLTVPEGESTKDVEALLGVAKGGTEQPESRSAQARERILDILDDEGPQESDDLDARIAGETGIAAKTVKNIRSTLAKEGLVKAYPKTKNEDGTVAVWGVGRTLAQRPNP